MWRCGVGGVPALFTPMQFLGDFFTLMHKNSSFQVKKTFTNIKEFGWFGLLLGMWPTSLINPENSP
jgi:hypothetical protein